jgi:hypothetical protein
MNAQFTRRQFVSTLVAGSTVAATLPTAMSKPTAARGDLSFLLLGDTHFDRREHHDFDWMRAHYAKDIEQVESYCRHTQDVLPKLLDAAKQRLAEANGRTAFALHVGDLIEGICGNRTLATRHCREGWDFFKAAQLGVPLLMTKGNHDITGPGAEEAYREVLMPETAKELGREKLEQTSYTFQREDNLFAAFDAYDPKAIDWLERVVQENDFRRLFVLVHMPVVPYNARSTWRVYHHPNQAERRQRLVTLLSRHGAIVLSGHLHKYSVVVRRGPAGKFVQLAVSSVLKDTEKRREPSLDSVDDYGPQLTQLEPDFSPETLDLRQQTLLDEKPYIEHFEYVHMAGGYAMVSVNADDVRADVYEGVEPRPFKQISLSDLLA